MGIEFQILTHEYTNLVLSVSEPGFGTLNFVWLYLFFVKIQETGGRIYPWKTFHMNKLFLCLTNSRKGSMFLLIKRGAVCSYLFWNVIRRMAFFTLSSTGAGTSKCWWSSKCRFDYFLIFTKWESLKQFFICFRSFCINKSYLRQFFMNSGINVHSVFRKILFNKNDSPLFCYHKRSVV